MAISDQESNKMPLYDKYIKDLGEDGTPAGEPCSFIKETIQSSCPGGRLSSDATGNSIRRDEVSKGSDVEILPKSKEEQIDFLKKIYEPVERSRVHGFDYDEKSLKMLLLDEKRQDSFKLIGVVGVLGVGKTTLTRLIFNDEEVKQRFVPRLWIPMSEEPWKPKSEKPELMEEVVERMLEHLGVQEETIKSISEVHKLPGLLYALYLHLKGKRFLIVLDDVRDHKDNMATDNKDNKANVAAGNKDKDKKESCCENIVSCLKKNKDMGKKEVVKNKNKEGIDEDEYKEKKDKQSYYENLVYCLKNGHGFRKEYGGAVIMTGRNEEAIKKMVGEQNLHRLLPLSDPESCWAIYKNLDASKQVTEEAKKPEASNSAADASNKGKQESKKVDQGSGSDVPKEVKEELKKRCGGFPLVARMMREIKERKDPNEASTTPKDGSDEATKPLKDSSSNEPSTTKEGSIMLTN